VSTAWILYNSWNWIHYNMESSKIHNMIKKNWKFYIHTKHNTNHKFKHAQITNFERVLNLSLSNVIQSLTHHTKCYKAHNLICQLSCTIISWVKLMMTQKRTQFCWEGGENLTLYSGYAFGHGFYLWEFVYWNLGGCFQFRSFMWFQCWEKPLSIYGNLCMLIILLYAF
jgi:hypothetical protein